MCETTKWRKYENLLSGKEDKVNLHTFFPSGRMLFYLSLK